MDLTPKVQFQNIAELTCHCHVKQWAATCSNRWQKFIDRPGLRLMVMAVCPRPPRQVMQHDSYDRKTLHDAFGEVLPCAFATPLLVSLHPPFWFKNRSAFCCVVQCISISFRGRQFRCQSPTWSVCWAVRRTRENSLEGRKFGWQCAAAAFVLGLLMMTVFA